MLHHYSDHIIMLDQKYEVRCKRAVQSKVMCSHESQHVEDGMRAEPVEINVVEVSQGVGMKRLGSARWLGLITRRLTTTLLLGLGLLLGMHHVPHCKVALVATV